MIRYRSTRLLFLGWLGIAVELTLSDRISFLGGRPEPLFLLACFAALFAAQPNQGLLVAWIFGLLKDLGSASPLGLHALLFVAIAWGILQLRRVVFREHPLPQFAVVLVGALLLEFLTAAFVCVVNGGIPFLRVLLKALSGALFSAALAPVVMWLLLRWKVFLRGT